MTTPAERVHASIEARSAQTDGHRDRGNLTRCPRCRARVIRALDDSVAAMTAVADLGRLSRADELAALLTGRDTYAVTTAPRLTLRRRDRWQIAGQPADTLVVVAEHRCGHPLGQPPAPSPADDRSATDVPY